MVAPFSSAASQKYRMLSWHRFVVTWLFISIAMMMATYTAPHENMRVRHILATIGPYAISHHSLHQFMVWLSNGSSKPTPIDDGRPPHVQRLRQKYRELKWFSKICDGHEVTTKNALDKDGDAPSHTIEPLQKVLSNGHSQCPRGAFFVSTNWARQLCARACPQQECAVRSSCG